MIANSKLHLFKQPEFRLPILDAGGKDIGGLVPIVGLEDHADALLDQIVDWRNRFRTAFKTQFMATKDDTGLWLRNEVIASDRRILFLVGVGDTFVGHIGLTDITGESAELDNVLRGERAGDPKLFTFALYALLKFAFEHLVVERVVSRVFANNGPAVRLYEKLGMKEVSASPLRKHEHDERTVYEECAAADANVAFQYATLMISSDDFAAMKREDLAVAGIGAREQL